MKDTIREFAEVLTQDREKQGLSVGEVARRARIAPQTVYAWEKGERTPEIEYLRRWAFALGWRLCVDMSMTRETP